MPYTRNILKHARFETAKGIRTCDVSANHQIVAGQSHFAYEEDRGIRKNICMSYAPSVLEEARRHLESLITQLPG